MAKTEPKNERSAEIATTALLEKLISQRGDIRICCDEQDGWFLKENPEDRHHERVMMLRKDDILESIDEAVIAAVKWHNNQVAIYENWNSPIRF